MFSVFSLHNPSSQAKNFIGYIREITREGLEHLKFRENFPGPGYLVGMQDTRSCKKTFLVQGARSGKL